MPASDALPYLGPLLSKPHIEWWLLAVAILVGVPLRETEYEPAIDDQGLVRRDELGRPVTRAVLRWRFRGLISAAWVAALGHSKLADRVSALETGVEGLRDGIKAFADEFRLWRTAIEKHGINAPASRASGASITPPALDSTCTPGVRGPMGSRPSLT